MRNLNNMEGPGMTIQCMIDWLDKCNHSGQNTPIKC
jgi:hypothetical protein